MGPTLADSGRKYGVEALCHWPCRGKSKDLLTENSGGMGGQSGTWRLISTDGANLPSQTDTGIIVSIQFNHLNSPTLPKLLLTKSSHPLSASDHQKVSFTHYGSLRLLFLHQLRWRLLFLRMFELQRILLQSLASLFNANPTIALIGPAHTMFKFTLCWRKVEGRS